MASMPMKFKQTSRTADTRVGCFSAGGGGADARQSARSREKYEREGSGE